MCTRIFLRSFSTAPRRVVVTGLGVISPVGCNVPTAWNNVLSGFCGISRLTDPAYDTLPCKIAAKIRESDLKLEDHFSKSELRAIAPATAFALLAGNVRSMNPFLLAWYILFCNVCSQRSGTNGQLDTQR